MQRVGCCVDTWFFAVSAQTGIRLRHSQAFVQKTADFKHGCPPLRRNDGNQRNPFCRYAAKCKGGCGFFPNGNGGVKILQQSRLTIRTDSRLRRNGGGGKTVLPDTPSGMETATSNIFKS
ncbi:hypothetical protein [Neisseria sp.]|uniref:hypothetical protein n=1 Tax=Neisseria sp. TaxID=192066 RepID=UPI00359FA999